MAKHSKKRRSARSITNPVLTANKIALSKLMQIDQPLSNKNIETTGDDHLIDTTEFQSMSDLNTPQNPITKHTKTSIFKPNPDVPFNAHSLVTNSTNGHEPKQSFVTDSVAAYFKLADDITDNSKLRFLSRDAEYCDDSDGSIDAALFEIEHGRPSVTVVTPPITHESLTENILLTYMDIRNKQFKSLVGLPDTTCTQLYNHETDVAINDDTEFILNPSMDMFMSMSAGENTTRFNQNETVNTFYFKAGSRTSNIIRVNDVTAAYFNIHGMLAVKPKPVYIDDLKTVTIYIEIAKAVTINAAESAPATDWIIAESKILPVNEYGVFLSMSTYLCKDAIVRLRINLDSTMGSLNLFQIRGDGGFTNHFSNTFTGFSGVITSAVQPISDPT